MNAHPTNNSTIRRRVAINGDLDFLAQLTKSALFPHASRAAAVAGA